MSPVPVSFEMIILLFIISENNNVWLDGYRSDEYVWRWGDDNVSIMAHYATELKKYLCLTRMGLVFSRNLMKTLMSLVKSFPSNALYYPVKSIANNE